MALSVSLVGQGVARALSDPRDTGWAVPRRVVRVTVDFLMLLDDERDGLPFIDANPDWILNGFKTVKGLKAILPGARFNIRLPREEIHAMRKRLREPTETDKTATKGIEP